MPEGALARSQTLSNWLEQSYFWGCQAASFDMIFLKLLTLLRGTISISRQNNVRFRAGAGETDVKNLGRKFGSGEFFGVDRYCRTGAGEAAVVW